MKMMMVMIWQWKWWRWRRWWCWWWWRWWCDSRQYDINQIVFSLKKLCGIFSEKFDHGRAWKAIAEASAVNSLSYIHNFTSELQNRKMYHFNVPITNNGQFRQQIEKVQLQRKRFKLQQKLRMLTPMSNWKRIWSELEMMMMIMITMFKPLNLTRSSWLNCALRDDEVVYWVTGW